jgi:hypothetical protein
MNRRAFLTRAAAVVTLGKAKRMSMTPLDYPDFVRVQQNQGAPVYNPGPITTATSVVSPLFYVGPWSALNLSIVFGGAAGQWGALYMEWYADAAATILVSEPGWVGITGSTVRETVQCRSQYVRFVSQYISGAGSSIITPIIVPVSGSFNIDSNTDAYEYLFNTQAYAANATKNLPLTPWTPGPVALSVQGTASFGVQLQDWAGPGVPAGQSVEWIATAAPFFLNVQGNIGRQQPTLVVTNAAGAQTIQVGVIGQAA